MKKLLALAVGFGASLPVLAAPTYDVSAAVTAIGAGSTPAAAIGTALVGLAAVFLIWRWIKGSMF